MSYQYFPLETGNEKKVHWVDHRATVRYQCPPATPGRVILVADQEYQRAWVQNLSLAGIALQILRPLPVGTYVVIQLRSPVTKKRYELGACVVHSTPRPNGEWVVGCELQVRLTEEDLDALL